MSSFNLFRQVAQAMVRFRGEHPTAGLPFTNEGMNEIQNRFALGIIELYELPKTENLVWRGKKGSRKLGERLIPIELLFGNESKLSVSVTGDTQDALDVLAEVWSELCQMAGNPVEPIQELGVSMYSTTATVEMPFPMENLFPGLRHIYDSVGEGVKQQGGSGIEERRMRWMLDIAIRTEGGSVPVTIVLEHKATTPPNRVLVTHSPLTTKQHAALLESLCAQWGSNRSSHAAL